LMTGIGIYFALPREPPPWAFGVIGLILILLVALIGRRRSVFAKFLLLALVGFSLAKVRTEWVAPSVLHAATGEAMLSGVVEEYEAKGPRRSVMVLRVTSLEGQGVTRNPSRARVTVNGTSPLRPG